MREKLCDISDIQGTMKPSELHMFRCTRGIRQYIIEYAMNHISPTEKQLYMYSEGGLPMYYESRKPRSIIDSERIKSMRLL